MIAPSELIINADGSVFHLHVKPEHLADRVILVGDPARVSLVASFFDTKECEVSSREFHTITGTYQGQGFSVFDFAIFKVCLLSLGLWLGTCFSRFFKKFRGVLFIAFTASWLYLFWRIFINCDDE